MTSSKDQSGQQKAGATPPSGRFQLDATGPAAYERYLVPAFFAPCADALLSLAPPRAGDRLLDLACGTGIVARQASGFVGRDGRLTSVDVNDAMIAQAQSVMRQRETPAQWVTADARHLPLEDDSIDVACCQQGLQFFGELAAVLREVRRVVVPGGRLLLAWWRDLLHHLAFALLADVLGRVVGPEAATVMEAPFGGPEPRQVQALLTNIGFPAVELRTFEFSARFPSVAAYLTQQAAGSPLAQLLDAEAPASLTRLTADLDYVLKPFVDSLGLALPMQTWLLMAHGRATDGRDRLPRKDLRQKGRPQAEPQPDAPQPACGRRRASPQADPVAVTDRGLIGCRNGRRAVIDGRSACGMLASSHLPFPCRGRADARDAGVFNRLTEARCCWWWFKAIERVLSGGQPPLPR